MLVKLSMINCTAILYV